MSSGSSGLSWLAGEFGGSRPRSIGIAQPGGSFVLLACICFMSLLSTGLQRFVVYGRVARSLVPFVVMICAFAFSPYLQRYGRRTSAVFVAAISFLAMTNFVPAIQQQYPLEIAWQVYQEYDDVSFEATVETT